MNKNKICIVCWKFNPNSMSKTCSFKCSLERKKTSQQQYKPVKQISDKKKLRLKETWGEKQLFIKVWAERSHICENCQKQILLPQSFCFAHRLSKKNYPALRVLKSNISLVCSIKCHNEIDSKINNLKKEIWYSEFEKMILDWKEKEIIDNLKKL